MTAQVALVIGPIAAAVTAGKYVLEIRGEGFNGAGQEDLGVLERHLAVAQPAKNIGKVLLVL